LREIKRTDVVLDKDQSCSIVRLEDATGVNLVIRTPLGWFEIMPDKVEELVKVLQM